VEERSQVGQKRESTRGTLTISTNLSSGHEYTPALPTRSWEMVACQSTSVFPYRETSILSCIARRKATQSAVA
jgi:hypothetical protein